MRQSSLAKNIHDGLKFRHSFESVLEKLDQENTLNDVNNFFDKILSDELVYMISSKLISFKKNLYQRSCWRI